VDAPSEVTAREPVVTQYAASPAVAEREADALARWLARRPGRRARLARQVVLVTVGLALVAGGVVLGGGADPAPTAAMFAAAAVAYALLAVLAGPRALRRRCRRLFGARVVPGSVVTATFDSARVEVDTSSATHRIDLDTVVAATWVGRDLVVECPGSMWMVLPGELLSDSAVAVLSGALGPRLRTLP
jgi:hypothetical protein